MTPTQTSDPATGPAVRETGAPLAAGAERPALDAETEDSIARTISELAGHVTTIVIAHRLATVRSADRVIYLEGGRLLAQGTFEEVRNTSERFALQANLLGL